MHLASSVPVAPAAESALSNLLDSPTFAGMNVARPRTLFELGPLELVTEPSLFVMQITHFEFKQSDDYSQIEVPMLLVAAMFGLAVYLRAKRNASK